MPILDHVTTLTSCVVRGWEGECHLHISGTGTQHKRQHSFVALLLGKLELSVDDAVRVVLDMNEKVNAEVQLLYGTISSKTLNLENFLRNMLKGYKLNPDELLMDKHAKQSCKM